MGKYSREERRLYQRQYRKNLRQNALDYLGGKCIKCGSSEDLEFDHIDPSTKKANISSMLDAPKTLFWEEVRKCQILCHDCHLEKTRIYLKIVNVGKVPANKIVNPEHGTERMYSREKCRCVLCKRWKKDYRNGLVDGRGNLKDGAVNLAALPD
jgi:hypothetical protein